MAPKILTMRWKADRAPKEGDKRLRYKFAWKPIRIGDEMVWLERYGISEMYTRVSLYDELSLIPPFKMQWVIIERCTLDYYC